MLLRKWCLILCLPGLLSACATMTNPVTGRSEFSVMDEREEVAEGRKGHEQVLREYGVYQNPAMQAYVNELGQKLAKQSHRQNLTWHFTVLDSPEINAFALPGGYVYVTRGIMAYMESEADLAGVIGHEIGHVTARHGAQRATRQQAAGIGVLAANILGVVLESQGVRGAGDLLNQGSQGLAAGYIASYGRDQELQADGLGAEYLARSHYDPKNMVDVIQVLKNQERFAEDAARSEGRAAPQRQSWLASHPSNDQRLHEIEQRASQYRGQFQEDGRSRYLKLIQGMTYGESRDQGLTRGANFYHEDLGIALTAPAGWRIQNAPDALTIVNERSDAALIMKLAPPSLGHSPDEIIRRAFNPQRGQLVNRQLNGMPAVHFAGLSRSQQGQLQQVEATVVSGPEQKHFLLLYAARDAQSLQRARYQIEQAESSFRRLSAEERTKAKPWQIRLQPFPPGGFPELARHSPLTAQAEAQLRLLNGHYNGGSPKAGQLVKVIE